MPDERCCATCAYHEHEDISDGYVCVNESSEHLADWTEDDDICGEYVRRS